MIDDSRVSRMSIRNKIRNAGLFFIVGLGIMGCEIEFEATFTPMVLPTLPTLMIFTTPGQGTAIPGIDMTVIPA